MPVHFFFFLTQVRCNHGPLVPLKSNSQAMCDHYILVWQLPTKEREKEGERGGKKNREREREREREQRPRKQEDF